VTHPAVNKNLSSPPGIIHHCVDCAALSPPTDAIRTLIGENSAWRLSRRPTRDGRHVHEWRCPTCWTSYFRAHKSA
jgi:hypothetical protein